MRFMRSLLRRPLWSRAMIDSRSWLGKKNRFFIGCATTLVRLRASSTYLPFLHPLYEHNTLHFYIVTLSPLDSKVYLIPNTVIMLPPMDPAVLERNPNFEILYKDLCTRKMNPDGSTRDTKKQRVHDEIRRVSKIAFGSDDRISTH